MRRLGSLLLAALLVLLLWAHVDAQKTPVQRCMDQVATSASVEDKWAARFNAVTYAITHPPDSFIDLFLDVARLLGKWKAAAEGGFHSKPLEFPRGSLCSCLLTSPGQGQQAPGAPDPAMLSTISLSGGGGFTAEQRGIAATALREARTRGISDRGVVVALAAGFQESGVRNLTYGDLDSVGWLQQRAGWGSLAQRMNPSYAAGKFFDALSHVNGWESMSVTAAAQAVQRSSFPNAYARWEPKAGALLASVQGSSPSAPQPAPGGPTVGPQAPPVGCPQSSQQGLAQAILSAPGTGQGVAGRRTVRDVDTGRVWQIPIPPGKAGIAVNAALDQVGKRYVWATRGPNTFDCSGLVSFAWAKAGVSVYPQTDVMWGQEPRATGMPRAGDLWGWPGMCRCSCSTIRPGGRSWWRHPTRATPSTSSTSTRRPAGRCGPTTPHLPGSPSDTPHSGQRWRVCAILKGNGANPTLRGD
jgi:cell wall-associated NlpC family hydrolase